jgi:hypothetical protein
MQITNIEILDHKTGLITQGIATELDSDCSAMHQRFLDAHQLAYWKLVILPIFSTTYVVIFSGAIDANETPNYKLGRLKDLDADVKEVLEAHHAQWSARRSPRADE